MENVKQGKIHGQISRDQMHDMWLPYGKRLTVSSEVSDYPTPQELTMIYFGASREDRALVEKQANGYRGKLRIYPRDWLTRTIKFLMSGANEQVVDYLLRSCQDQLLELEDETDRIRESQGAFLDAFSRALGALASEDVLTHPQAELMERRIYDRYGNPQTQEAPMTKLQLARHYGLTHDGALPDHNLAFAADLNFGLLWEPVCLLTPEAFKLTNRVREHLHSVQGLEIFDVTYDNGLRLPSFTATGHYLLSGELDTKISREVAYNSYENLELTEGFIEYLTMRMFHAVPDFGVYAKGRKLRSAYDTFRDTMAKLHRNYPLLFNAIAEASLFENPDSNSDKRDILTDMHRLGIAILGTGGINGLMQSKQSFKEIYNNDNRPDVMNGES